MQYLRPNLIQLIKPVRTFQLGPIFGSQMRTDRNVAGLSGLGELGDIVTGTAAQAQFQDALKTHIIGKAGPQNLANGNAIRSLVDLISFAAVTYQLGSAGSLQPAQQNYWSAWQAQAQSVSSDDHLAWLFGKYVFENKVDLMNAAAAFDAAAGGAQVVYTGMDTSTTGTNWYGGTVTSSKLNNPQWASLFTKAWSVLLKAARNGVLPLSYLGTVVKSMAQSNPVSRRFPVFSTPPGSVPFEDPKAIAFRAALRQLGWTNVVNTWFDYTQQSWAKDAAEQERTDAYYSGAITAMSYVSGAKIMEQVEAQLARYWQVRDDALRSFFYYDTIKAGPLANQVPFVNGEAMSVLKDDFNDTDKLAHAALSTVGMWPSGTRVGVGDLGVAGVILYGVTAVAVLGVVAYIVSLMTNTSRVAVDQSKNISKAVLMSVETMQSSCQREFAISARTPADEETYRQCVERAAKIATNIPSPPAGSSDPLGFKGIAMAVTALVGGFVVYQMTKKPKAPKSFKVVADEG